MAAVGLIPRTRCRTQHMLHSYLHQRLNIVSSSYAAIKSLANCTTASHNKESKNASNQRHHNGIPTTLLAKSQLVIQPHNALTRAYLSTQTSVHCANKTDTKSSATTATDLYGEATKLGLFAKFKHMYKKYWYVLIPVHVVTSIGWFGAFYYLSKSGVDVPCLLQYLHLSETIIEKVQNSDMGHYAVAYLCYKVATPLRYAITLGGTTISIKHLVQAGYIKPMPTKSELMSMYKVKTASRIKPDQQVEDFKSDSNELKKKSKP